MTQVVVTMPTSSNYWKQRFTILEESQLNKGQSYYADLEKQYRIASLRVEKDIDVWYQRFAANNNISMVEAKRLLNTKELEEFKWDVEDYIKHGEMNAVDPLWMKQLENASARVHINRLEALRIQTQQKIEVLFGNQIDGIDKLARNIYSDGYYHTAFEIQKGFNIGYDFQKIDEKKLEQIISKPWTMDNKTFTARCWESKAALIDSVHTNLTQGIIRGDAPDKTIRAISKQFGVAKNRAGRLVMTESAFFASAAQKDCFNSLNVEKYEICATLDLLTSELCQGLDGQVIPMSEYAPGSTAPPFHAWCRTVTIPWFDDNYGSRIAKTSKGQNYYLPADVKYPEWKETFVDGGSKVDLTPWIDNKIYNRLV
jgi:SPP1 gp7 family putative phage head morphogenesis protein